MNKPTQSSSAPAANPLDHNTLCNAIDLLDEAYAISAFMAASTDQAEPDVILSSKEERRGFYLIMCDLAERIQKASFLVDEYREGASHD
jgi:hypothetical protein